MRKVFAIVLLTLAAMAQEKPAALVSKAFEVKPGNAERIANALNSLGASVSWSRDANMIVVRTTENMLPAFDQVVRRLDAAPPPADRNLELTIYLVQASQQPGPEAALPGDLAPVVKQLRAVFAYQNYRVLDTLLLRTREGQNADTSGVLTLGVSQNGRDAGSYSFRVRGSVRGEGKERVIRIDNLSFDARVPVPAGENQFNFHQVSIRADLDFKEGQKVVVGKTSMQGAERALILVITGKVIE